jgi:hypothetical protein
MKIRIRNTIKSEIKIGSMIFPKRSVGSGLNC